MNNWMNKSLISYEMNEVLRNKFSLPILFLNIKYLSSILTSLKKGDIHDKGGKIKMSELYYAPLSEFDDTNQIMEDVNFHLNKYIYYMNSIKRRNSDVKTSFTISQVSRDDYQLHINDYIKSQKNKVKNTDIEIDFGELERKLSNYLPYKIDKVDQEMPINQILKSYSFKLIKNENDTEDGKDTIIKIIQKCEIKNCYYLMKK